MPTPFTEPLLPNCPDTHFTCTNKNCVSGNTVCDNIFDCDERCNFDNVTDCEDKSDEEIGCNGKQNNNVWYKFFLTRIF